jgi:MFS superfamily sulfate permease-like transporter
MILDPATLVFGLAVGVVLGVFACAWLVIRALDAQRALMEALEAGDKRDADTEAGEGPVWEYDGRSWFKKPEGTAP